MDSLDAFASGIMGPGVDSVIDFLRFCSLVDASKASSILQLSSIAVVCLLHVFLDGDDSIGTQHLQD
jgi:hypothetical protein